MAEFARRETSAAQCGYPLGRYQQLPDRPCRPKGPCRPSRSVGGHFCPGPDTRVRRFRRFQVPPCGYLHACRRPTHCNTIPRASPGSPRARKRPGRASVMRSSRPAASSWMASEARHAAAPADERGASKNQRSCHRIFRFRAALRMRSISRWSGACSPFSQRETDAWVVPAITANWACVASKMLRRICSIGVMNA